MPGSSSHTLNNVQLQSLPAYDQNETKKRFNPFSAKVKIYFYYYYNYKKR